MNAFKSTHIQVLALLCLSASLSAASFPLPAAATQVECYDRSRDGGPENFSVVINELMSSNTATVADEAGEFDDWIELYNKSSNAIDLSGYHLSDNPDKHGKWTFLQGTVIGANGYLIVWADEDSSQGPLHANFKLSSTGESLIFSAPDKTVLDSLTFPEVPADMGYARVPNGTGPFVIQAPTYKAANSMLATHESFAVGEVAVFPNPASSWLYLKLPAEEAWVRIIDMQGKTVLEQQISGVKRLNIADLPAGKYAASITMKNGQATRLFVKN